MKYTYAYKTGDGTRHEASIDAESREAVFIELRKRGIKAIKVVAADGSKANGEIRGVRKRVVVLAVALASIIVGGGVYLSVDHDATPVNSTFDALTRRQVFGDLALVEKGILTGWSDVFPNEGERFLASFAIPGVKAGQRNTTVQEIEAALSRHVLPTETDGIEARQIKAMVEGMKQEASAYIKAGGTIVGYGKRLTERQDAEIAFYERIKNELEAAHKEMDAKEYIPLWEKRNAELRNLGIRLVGLE